MSRSLKKKLVRAKIALHQTIQHILEINRTRKKIRHLDDGMQRQAALEEELKVLNKIAAQKAKLIQHYENSLNGDDRS